MYGETMSSSSLLACFSHALRMNSSFDASLSAGSEDPSIVHHCWIISSHPFVSAMTSLFVTLTFVFAPEEVSVWLKSDCACAVACCAAFSASRFSCSSASFLCCSSFAASSARRTSSSRFLRSSSALAASDSFFLRSSSALAASDSFFFGSLLSLSCGFGSLLSLSL